MHISAVGLCLLVGGTNVSDYHYWKCNRNRNRTREGFANNIASLEALGPRMIEVSGSDISTILEPSTTARATTAFAGFCGSAALGTLATAAYRGWTRKHKSICGDSNGCSHNEHDALVSLNSQALSSKV